MSPLWTRRSMLVFFALGFGVPWVGWTLVALAPVPRPSPLATALFYTGDFMSVGGLVAAWVAGGRAGLGSLLRRAIRIRAPVGWILFALFLPLLGAMTVRVAYGIVHGGVGAVNLAGFATYVAPGVLLALTTGPLGEEAGWRGYLLPRLLGRFSPLSASLVLGVLWSVWHYPLYADGVFATAGGALRFSASVLCFSVLLTVLWAHTGGSVFWAVAMHWTINVSGRVAEAVLPHAQAPPGATDWLNLGVLVVITGATVALARPARVRARAEAVVADLAAESLAADRRPA